MSIVTVVELALRQRGGFAFQLLDVRRAQARAADKWITRERPKIERTACPCVVAHSAHFIDADAEFGVPRDEALHAWCQHEGAAPG